jgi:hypothetical protein
MDADPHQVEFALDNVGSTKRVTVLSNYAIKNGTRRLRTPRDVVARADTKGVIYERAGDCFCRRVGF